MFRKRLIAAALMLAFAAPTLAPGAAQACITMSPAKMIEMVARDAKLSAKQKAELKRLADKAEALTTEGRTTEAYALVAQARKIVEGKTSAAPAITGYQLACGPLPRRG